MAFLTPCCTYPKPFLRQYPVRLQKNVRRLWSPRITPVNCAEAGEVQSEVVQSNSPFSDKAELLRVSTVLLGFLGFGVSNRVVYKMTLVPLKEYVFFLAQFISLVYLFVYCPVLYFRHKSGIVTDEMLSIPKLPFVIVGFCESVASLLLLISAARLPGVIIPLLQQLLIFWQMIVSSIVLGTRYSLLQLLGVGLVVAGSTLASQATIARSSPGSASILFILLMNLAFFLYSVDVVTKEKIFKDAKERLDGKNLDLFVVNSFSSVAQVVGTLLLFPFMLQAKKIAIKDLPTYVSHGIKCLCGVSPTPASDCTGASLLVLLYIFCNLGFNLTGLFLLRKAGAVVVSISSSVIVPLTIAVFSLSLPYLGAGTQLSLRFLLGSASLVLGLLVYSSKDIMASRKIETNRS